MLTLQQPSHRLSTISQGPSPSYVFVGYRRKDGLIVVRRLAIVITAVSIDIDEDLIVKYLHSERLDLVVAFPCNRDSLQNLDFLFSL